MNIKLNGFFNLFLRFSFIFILITTYFLSINLGFSAPKKELIEHWIEFNPKSTEVIQYPTWQKFLANYLKVDNEQTLIAYQSVTAKDKIALAQAIQRLESIPVENYNRKEQLAYWINLYNMETVYLILEHYPIQSIKDISSGFFSFGPWDEKLFTINGQKLSLNDIEHGIIRPIWNDPRIHAAVNCASMSCPNLRPTPFEGKKIYTQLNQAFSQFVNSDKGVRVKGNSIFLSEIFNWYAEDFGTQNKDILDFILIYASPALKQKIKNIPKNNIDYQFNRYDWSLNQT